MIKLLKFSKLYSGKMKKVFLIFILIIIIISCREEQKQVQVESQVTGVFAPVLSKEILRFISFFDSLALKSKAGYVPPVFEMEFSESKGDCFLTIIQSDFYSLKYDGYCEFNGKIICFTNLDNICSKNLIDRTKIKKDSKKYFENSALIYLIIDPIKRRYKIISSDSLILVYQGFWTYLVAQGIISQLS